ncbi:hypothetical protein Tco_0713057 [Tanacetum coccineum]
MERIFIRHMDLPPRDQRHQYLKFEGLQYTEGDIADFETRFGEAMLDLDTAGALQFQFGEMQTAGFGLYWAESARQIPDKGDLSAYWIRISSVEDFLGMDVGSVNVPYLLARYLRLFASGRNQGEMISGGQFFARLANHFGLLTEERLQGLTVIVRDLPIIDMAELVRLQTCVELDDT